MSSVNGPTPGATIVKVGWLHKRGILVQGLSSQRGEDWDFLFCGFSHILDWFSGFVPKNFGFSVLVSVVVWGFCSILLSVSSFRICYLMRFGVFPVSLEKICASVTLTMCMSLILLAVFGFG